MTETQFFLELKALEFYESHGIYALEKQVKQHFAVDVALQYTIKQNLISLDQCIDYTQVAQVIKLEMQKPQELLETLVLNIKQQILLRFVNCTHCTVKISKKPQIGLAYESISIEA